MAILLHVLQTNSLPDDAAHLLLRAILNVGACAVEDEARNTTPHLRVCGRLLSELLTFCSGRSEH
jgi:hypothetical protein